MSFIHKFLKIFGKIDQGVTPTVYGARRGDSSGIDFFFNAQKRSKLRQTDIYIYINVFVKFGIKLLSQK